jgi:alkaline phosphatase D
MEGKRSVNLTGTWDTRISRRVLLRTGGSAAAGLFMLGRVASSAAAPPWDQVNPFSLGVASGDPSPDGFVLWTRLLPEGTPLDGSVMKQEPYGVRYEVAADPQFRTIVRRGSEEAVWEESHTVHAEIAGLPSDRWYWYRFQWGRAISPVGRTRTAPALGAAVDTLRFAFASCQNWPGGYYTAYADLAAQELDLVVHLGDYIYEGVTPQGKVVAERNASLRPVAETVSLSDYRIRHALYKTDAHLQEAHRLFPWLATWDDHEVEDNYAGLVMNPEVPLVDAKQRRAAAYLAYWEHQPLSRSRKPVNESMPIYRRAHWGALASFHVIDTRQHRANQLDGCGTAGRHASGYCHEQLNPVRQVMGDEQRLWLYDGLAERPTGSGWNVVANQVGFAPQETGDGTAKRFGTQDSWDGYAGDRQRLLEHIKARDLRNVVVITGDKHIHSVRNVPPDYNFANFAETPVATEFIGTSITSGGQRDPVPIVADPDNPHHLWTEPYSHGYVRVELNAETWRSDFRVVETVEQQSSAAWTASSWEVEHDRPGADSVPAV